MSHRKSSKDSNITRRDALKFLGASATATLVPRTSSPSEQKSLVQHADVAVVGAGFSGMIAAKNLIRAGKKVVVLEARDRVGGRVKAGRIAGQTVDVGAMWVGPTQTRVLDLIKEYGLHTIPQFETGKNIAELDGKRTTADRERLGLDAKTLAEYERVIVDLNHLTDQVPLDAPWTMPQADVFDAMSAEEWFNAKTRNKALRSIFQLTTRTDFTADPSQISFLYFLTYLRSGDNFDVLNGFENGAQAFVVKESFYRLAQRVAEELGDAIVQEAPVSAISQDATGVTVTSQKGSWQVDYVVVAVPLPLSVRIQYQPPLPAERDLLTQHMPMGSVIKCWVAYEKPFWREKGLNGLVWSERPPIDAFCDGTPPEGSPGLLVGFIDGRNALKWTGRPIEERKKAIIDQLVSFLGSEAAHPIDYEDQDWPAELWSRGCFSVSMPPGVMTTLGRVIRQPHGRIHWAGTETSTRWMGYVDGAIRSGERAVAEILTNYQRSKQPL
jgi:monoamine oxidase